MAAYRVTHSAQGAPRRESGFLVNRDPAGRHSLCERLPLRGRVDSDPPREIPRGFTLIEVMVAILLTALTVIGVLGLFRVETRASQFSRRSTEAAVLAQDKLEELRTRASGSETKSEQPWDYLKGRESDLFTRSWTVEPAPGDASILQIEVVVSWEEDGIRRDVTVRGFRGST